MSTDPEERAHTALDGCREYTRETIISIYREISRSIIVQLIISIKKKNTYFVFLTNTY